MRVVHVNMNGLNEDWKRRDVIEAFGKGKVDILGIGETHLQGCGATEYGNDGK